MDAVSAVAALALATALAWAAFAKLARPRRFARALAVQRLPQSLAAAAALAVPALELAAAALLFAGRPREGGLLALALLGAFSLSLLHARALVGRRVPCGCFGGDGERDYRALLARNALLAVLAVIAAIGAGAPLESSGVPGEGELAPALISAAGLTLAAWTAREALLHLRR